jgi:hypothetical protein
MHVALQQFVNTTGGGLIHRSSSQLQELGCEEEEIERKDIDSLAAVARPVLEFHVTVTHSLPLGHRRSTLESCLLAFRHHHNRKTKSGHAFNICKAL